MTDERADLTKPGVVRPAVPAELLDAPWFPFTGDVRVKALLAPVIPILEPAIARLGYTI